MKLRNIKFIFLFLICLPILTSCNMDSLGDDISNSISQNLIPNLWSTLAQILATVILFVCIIFLAYKPAKKFLKNRQEALDKEVEDTKKNAREAANKNLEADKNIAESKKHAKEIVERAKIDANLEKQEILESANEEAERKLKDADAIISKRKEEAYDEIKDAVVDVAFTASKKILEREINEDDNQKIVDDFIDEIEKKDN